MPAGQTGLATGLSAKSDPRPRTTPAPGRAVVDTTASRRRLGVVADMWDGDRPDGHPAWPDSGGDLAMLPVPPGPKTPWRPIKVLVCDDQALVRAGYVTTFTAQPDLAVVGEAGDGQTAVELARRLRPDVVVTDIRMPGLDGIEAIRLLAGPNVVDPLKVLVVTDLDQYVYEALRAGAGGFLLKGSALPELVAGVRSVAAGEAPLAPAVTRGLIGRFGSRVRAADPQTPEKPLATLTGREREVLKLIATGLSNSEIAVALMISQETVKTYVSRILAKLDLRDRVQVVILAYRIGLVSPGE
jgi:DNA-binding NarL/FixJ family response regulator